jgi:nucleoside diphosphate kinase
VLTTSDSTCPDFLTQDSFLVRLGQQHQVWNQIRELLPPELVGLLSECVFMMIKPDALAEGKHDVLLAAMRRAGWKLLYSQATLAASLQHFEELYKYNLTIRNEQNMVGAWWINAPLYEMAPSIALVFYIPDDRSGLTAHQRVKALKGASNPFAGKAGEIRWEAGATNLALNLLHSADDPISTVREFLIFSTAAQLITVLRQAKAMHDSPGGATGMVSRERAALDSFEEQVFLAGTGTRRLDLPSVLVGVKSRLRAATGDSKFADATSAVYAQYRELARLPASIDSRWPRFCEINAAESAIIDGLRFSRATDDSLHRLLCRLAIPRDYCYDVFDDVHIEFMRQRMAVDPWDKLALATSLYYFSLFPTQAGHNGRRQSEGNPACAG